MASYLSVISNDTLNHKALQGSPETLCGKLVIDTRSPREVPELDNTTFQALTCDVCETLTGGDSLIKENIAAIHEASRACPHCQDGFDSTGTLCWNCGGTGWLTEGDDFDDYYEDLTGIDVDDLRGTKIANDEKCDNCGESTGGISKTVGNEQHCMTCVLAPTSVNTEYKKAGWKEATNWTRDGAPIEDGFTIDTEQASRIPFLDYTRVAVSERRECPDCNTSQWISKIAGCDTCGLLKCNSCMESIGPSQFVGMCKLCAGSESDLAYEIEYEDPYQGGSLYHDYLMSETEGETDPLFLPDSTE